jgi:hypothetical protein
MSGATRMTTAFVDDEAANAATTVVGITRPNTADTTAAVAGLIRFLETGNVPDGLFADEVFADLSLPHWRLQAQTAAEVIALRTEGHPFRGQLQVERVDPTEHGFVIEFTERWESEGQRWYCREMIRADVMDGSIVEMSIYCTGDWDEAKQREHADAVRLIRP